MVQGPNRREGHRGKSAIAGSVVLRWVGQVKRPVHNRSPGGHSPGQYLREVDRAGIGAEDAIILRSFMKILGSVRGELGVSRRKTIIDRYERSEQGKLFFDVWVPGPGHLYSNFDRTVPYLKKDLEQEFVDHLTDSAREVRNHSFIIRLSMPQMPEEHVQERIRRSIKTYYAYLSELEMRAIKAMFRRSLSLFLIGLVLLILAIAASRRVELSGGVVAEVFAQGLTIAAWVSLWEAIANLLLEWHPHSVNIRLHNRITNAPVHFRVREF